VGKPRDSEHQLKKPVEAAEKQAYEKPRLEHHAAAERLVIQSAAVHETDEDIRGDPIIEVVEVAPDHSRVERRTIELAPRIAELRERAGRRVPVSYYAAPPEDAFIERLNEAGVDRALLDVPSEGADTVLPLLERYAELAARHR
jgi:hypothetical protein